MTQLNLYFLDLRQENRLLYVQRYKYEYVFFLRWEQQALTLWLSGFVEMANKKTKQNRPVSIKEVTGLI